MMQFQCPGCGQTLEAPAGAFSVEGKCKFCGEVIISPASSDAGATLKQDAPPTPPPPQPSTPPSFGAAQAPFTHHAPKQGNGLALASVILGVLGIVTCGATALPGLICGIMALFKTGTGPESRSGRSMALAGTILSGILLLSIPLMAAILFPVFSKARERARGAACMSNVMQLGVAMQMYQQDYQDTFPPTANWDKLLTRYTKSPNVYSCPAIQDQSARYKMNSALDSIKVSALSFKAYSQTPTLFDAAPGGPISGGPSDVVARHFGSGRGKVAVIGFADGHVKNTSPGEVRGLMWSPGGRGE